MSEKEMEEQISVSKSLIDLNNREPIETVDNRYENYR